MSVVAPDTPGLPLRTHSCPPPPPLSLHPPARLPVHLFFRRCCPLPRLLRFDEQGGEFAFVAFGMAERLGILEPQLCKLLLTTVAISMAATPALSTFSAWVADQVRQSRASGSPRGVGITDTATRPRRRHRWLHAEWCSKTAPFPLALTARLMAYHHFGDFLALVCGVLCCVFSILHYPLPAAYSRLGSLLQYS